MIFFLNDVKNHDNLARLVARNLQQGEGLSQRCETKLKQFTFGTGTVFCPKLPEVSKKKKKSLRMCWDRVLRSIFLLVQS